MIDIPRCLGCVPLFIKVSLAYLLAIAVACLSLGMFVFVLLAMQHIF